MQQQLIDWSPRFDGETLVTEDHGRLAKQLAAVKALMADGAWRSLGQIAAAVQAPEASVSARLRDLRRLKHGAYTVERQRLPGGLHLYRVKEFAPWGDRHVDASSGMSLRDYFAAQVQADDRLVKCIRAMDDAALELFALHPDCEREEHITDVDLTCWAALPSEVAKVARRLELEARAIARVRYMQADAMLAAREGR